MAERFEWDPKKAASNLKRHGISFEDAVGVFGDPLARIFDDEDFAVGERRDAPGRRQGMSGKTMRKGSHRKRRPSREDMRREYRFDYRKARPNRFAGMLKGTTAVVLDPDVASVFESPESVNRLLRSVIAAFPANAKTHRRRG